MCETFDTSDFVEAHGSTVLACRTVSPARGAGAGLEIEIHLGGKRQREPKGAEACVPALAASVVVSM